MRPRKKSKQLGSYGMSCPPDDTAEKMSAKRAKARKAMPMKGTRPME